MSHCFTRILRNDYPSLRALCAAAKEFMESHSLPPDAMYAADLALEELVSNVIKYGHDDTASHEIKTLISIERDHLLIAIEDDGREFDPTSAPPPDIDKPLEERKVGGLGIHLVRNVSESISYRREGNRNIVKVQVRLNAKPAGTERHGTENITASG